MEGQGTSSSSKVTLGECAAFWIARHEQLRKTFFQVRQVLNRLVARHGRDAITLWVIASSTRGCDRCHSCPGHAAQPRRVTRRFFAWCQDYLEAIPRNPMKRLQERRRASGSRDPDARADAGVP